MAQPSVALSFDPPGPQFVISEQCEMPSITVTAALQNCTPDPKAPLQFQWAVTLTFKGGTACPHSMSRTTNHAPISAVTPSNKFKIPFTQIRGGELTVKVSVQVGANLLTAQSQGLNIGGTNPTVASLSHVAPPKDGFRKLMRQESSLKQFISPECPQFSGDNLGGVGLCQLTYPAPTDDQIWSWKANLQGGIALWNEKESTAKSYLHHYPTGTAFKKLVQDYNAQRAAAALAAQKPAANLPPAPASPLSKLAAEVTAAAAFVAVTLPPYTAEQLERETLRGFNGYAGNLHEYRAKVDANGLLIVKLSPDGTKGTAEWEEVSAADRIKHYDKIGLAANHRGDPNYVENVEKKATF
jgi:hypothetical protein